MQKHLNKLKSLFSKARLLIDKYELLKYSVAAMLLAIPIYPKFPFITVPGTYVSIRIEDFMILVVVGLWIIRFTSDYKSILKNRIAQAIIIFWLVTLVSVISAIFLTKTVDYHVVILHWIRRVEYMIMFFIGLTTVKSKKDIEFYIKTIFIVIFTVFIFGVGQKFFDWPIITTQNQEYSKGIALRYMPGGHLPSTFAGHYDLAAYIILTSPLLFGLCFSDLFRDKKTKMFIFAFVAMSFWLLIETISRTSIVSYVISVSILLFLIRKKRLIPVFWVVVFVIAGMSQDLIGRYKSILEVVLKKVKLMFTVHTVYAQDTVPQVAAQTPAPVPVLEDRSSSIRFNVEWPRAIRALTKNPLMGTGFSSITLATDNDYLRLLGEAGITGFLAFALIFKRLVRPVWTKIRSLDLKDTSDLYFISFISTIPGILLVAVFIDIFESSKFAITFWLMLGLAVATLKESKNEQA